jgi:hypothetical protein
MRKDEADTVEPPMSQRQGHGATSMKPLYPTQAFRRIEWGTLDDSEKRPWQTGYFAEGLSSAFRSPVAYWIPARMCSSIGVMA